ncbi:LIM domain-containing protein [Sporobolomyces koalae]|uniref:LIM domain-containing protein n=1 Tax=Sporobolomyces koalae TaxID=500713 RepID=UPI003180BE4F
MSRVPIPATLPYPVPSSHEHDRTHGPTEHDPYAYTASSVPPRAVTQHVAPAPPPRTRRAGPLPAIPAQPAVTTLEHHKSLVAYYWHYAQQGYSAPLTAPSDTREHHAQLAARNEAVEWARQCGISIPPTDPTPPIPIESRPAPVAARPLPSVPPASRSVSLANPPHPTLPPVTPPLRSVSETQPRPEPKKRPLPARPSDLVEVATQLDRVSISSSPVDSVPPAPPPARSRSPRPASPAVPTFSFSTDDCDDDSKEGATTAPAIPSFSFSIDDEGDTSTAPPPAQPRPPPLHPRYDPTHPSHALYHPTSTASANPLDPSSSSSLSLSAGPTLLEAGTISCTSCRQAIFGRVLFALDRSWHPDCFVCHEPGCREKLEVMEFEATPEDWVGSDSDPEEDLTGKAWCMVHFEERFALECYHCHTPISSADYLPICDPSLPPFSKPGSKHHQSNTRYYHPLHFFCSGCGDPFLDPVAYERTGEAVVTPYYVHERYPYCHRCDLRMWRDKCTGCHQGLREEDGYVEIDAPGQQGERKQKWHQGCFKCSMCEKPLMGIYLLKKTKKKLQREDNEQEEEEEEDGERPYCGECFDMVAKGGT